MDWGKWSRLLEALREDAEKKSLNEFLDTWGPWFFPYWDKFNKDPDHDEQLFGDENER
jgi:hypothetical protein